MRISLIGTGYVGLVTGACFAEFGFDVTCLDMDATRVDNLTHGIMPFFEPGLESLVAQNARLGRLKFSTDMATSVPQSDVVFIAVGTPNIDGKPDLSYVFNAAQQLSAHLSPDTVVVMKSTVPAGTTRKVQEIIRQARPDLSFYMASNPEFLRQGSAVRDFMYPDRVVIGLDDAKTSAGRTTLMRLYRPLSLNDTPLIVTAPETAEMIKYAANAFLSTKIAFINEMADICEQMNANIEDLAIGIGLDERIGQKFLRSGPGYGGSCFPKDTEGLAQVAQSVQAPSRITEAVIASNKARRLRMADKICAELGATPAGKTVAILGLTFKPNTDDMRESPALDIIPALIARGVRVQAYDPIGIENAKRVLPTEVIYTPNAYAAMTGAQAAVLLTEWAELRGLDFEKMAAVMTGRTIVDLRNIYKPDEMTDSGFDYVSIGRPALRHTPKAREVA